VSFGIFLAALAILAGLVYRRRLRAVSASDSTHLNDDMIRQIETSGWVEVDEPLDLDTIRDEESRFLEEETWDEADEW
jgi:hypothetical protein